VNHPVTNACNDFEERAFPGRTGGHCNSRICFVILRADIHLMLETVTGWNS